MSKNFKKLRNFEKIEQFKKMLEKSIMDKIKIKKMVAYKQY